MIIALTGNNGVGKDTVASIIQTILNNNLYYQQTIDHKYYERWEIKKFADLPNELYTRITNVKFGALEGYRKEAERQQFIDFCQKNKEVFGEYIWADILLRDYNNEKKWIISDLRFYEEYITLDDKNAIFIRIMRDGYNSGRIPFKNCDYIIENNRGMIDLKNKVRDILNQLELL